VVPAAIGLAVTPLLLYKLMPPEVKQTPEAPAVAAEKLKAMGPMSRDESIMLGTMCFALVLWVRHSRLLNTAKRLQAAESICQVLAEAFRY
jgi:di/tricarboxylate transporter